MLPAAAGLLVQRFVTFCSLLAFEARGELLARLFVPYETRVITGEGKGERALRAAEVIGAVPPSARGLPRGRSVSRAHPDSESPASPPRWSFNVLPRPPPLLSLLKGSSTSAELAPEGFDGGVCAAGRRGFSGCRGICPQHMRCC